MPSHAINLILNGLPGPEGCDLIEIETDDGRSIDVGEWIQRSDGLWSVRITVDDLQEAGP